MVRVGIIGGGAAGNAAAADDVRPDPAGIEFFEKSVRPLLIMHCAECHDDGKTEGGLSMGSRAAMLKGGDSGVALVPGKPDESRLIQAVRYTDQDLQTYLGDGRDPKRAFASSRTGAGKVMFAGYYSVGLSWERVFTELDIEILAQGSRGVLGVGAAAGLHPVQPVSRVVARKIAA